MRVSTSCACAQRRDDAQDRLVRKEWRALGQGGDLAGEAQRRQRIDEVPSEAATARQPRKLLFSEMKGFKIVEHLLQPGGNEEIAVLRHLAHEELECRRAIHAAVVIDLQHGELVKVREQR